MLSFLLLRGLLQLSLLLDPSDDFTFILVQDMHQPLKPLHHQPINIHVLGAQTPEESSLINITKDRLFVRRSILSFRGASLLGELSSYQRVSHA